MIRDGGRTTGRFIKNHPAIVARCSRKSPRLCSSSDIRVDVENIVVDNDSIYCRALFGCDFLKIERMKNPVKGRFEKLFVVTT